MDYLRNRYEKDPSLFFSIAGLILSWIIFGLIHLINTSYPHDFIILNRIFIIPTIVFISFMAIGRFVANKKRDK